MKISAVIPAYNAEDTIARALRSVVNQTHPVDEIIVVDDGSTDRTAEIVQEQFPQVICIRQENAGVSATRNRGAEAASGEWIAFLDSDDEWLPEKIERQKAVIEGHPAIGGVACLIIGVCNGREIRESTPFPLGTVRALTFHDFWEGPSFFVGASYIFCKDAFDRVAGFDDQLPSAEETDLLLRMTAYGYQFMVLQDHLYVHHQTVVSLTRGGEGPLRLAQARIAALERWNPKTGSKPRLLSQAEYDAKIGRAYSLAIRTAAVHRVALEPEFIGRATQLAAHSPLRVWQLFMASCLPGVYRLWLLCYKWGRRLAGRVYRSLARH